MAYILCAAYVIFSVSGLTLFKIGSSITEGGFCVPVLNFMLNGYSFAGICCYGISFLLYLGVVSKFNLGFIIPIVGGIVNIAILLISIFLLKETISINMILGAFIVVLGIAIMNWK